MASGINTILAATSSLNAASVLKQDLKPAIEYQNAFIILMGVFYYILEGMYKRIVILKISYLENFWEEICERNLLINTLPAEFGGF